MDVLLEYCEGCGKHINQDIVGYSNNIYWVIDGATEVFSNYYLSSQGDVQWVVNVLNEELKKSDTTLPLKEILRTAICRMNSKALEIAPEIRFQELHTLPTYAICCIKCNHDSIDYLCLGDCSLFISSNPQLRITDNRIKPFHLYINSIKEKYKDDPLLYKEQVIKAVKKIKQSLNKEGGYWIGNFDSSIVDHAVTGTINVLPRNFFILCSDGFRPNLDEAGLISYDPAKIFQKEYLVDILCKQKESEVSFYNKTGIDIMDDTTVLLVQI